ncbi:MAG: hypothetical protein ACREFP_21700 [Acetobacteraceae bacterium]
MTKNLNVHADSSVAAANEAIRQARGYSPKAVAALIEIVESPDTKRASPYIKSRCAALLLEVGGLVRTGPAQERAPEAAHDDERERV